MYKKCPDLKLSCMTFYICICYGSQLGTILLPVRSTSPVLTTKTSSYVANAYVTALFTEVTILSSLSCGGTFVRNEHKYYLLITHPFLTSPGWCKGA